MTMTPEARAEHVQHAVDAWDSSTGRSTHRVPFRDERQDLPVVRVSLDAVMLNHRSHRIQSQLESHEQAEIVRDDPESPEAQELIAEILRGTDEFEDLKSNLATEGQNDPGVITRSGLLVNANTRTVALRDLEQAYLEVAVLPTSATDEDIDRVELALQVSRDWRQDYTFTNRLLFIHEQREKFGYTTERIAHNLGYAVSSDARDLKNGVEQVEQELRLLAMIREVQAMSEPRIPLTFFDNRKQLLVDIDKKYQSEKKRDQQVALRLRDTQLIGLFLETSGYRELRKVNEDFFDDYLIPAMEDSEELSPLVQSLARTNGDGADDEGLGLDIFGDEGGDIEVGDVDPASLLRLLSDSHNKEEVEFEDGDGQVHRVPRERLVDQLDAAVSDAFEEAKADGSTQDKLTYPNKTVKEANAKIGRAKKAYEGVKGNAEFDVEQLLASVNRLVRSAQALQATVQRSKDDRDASRRASA